MANWFTLAELASRLQQDVDNSTGQLLADQACDAVRDEIGQVVDRVLADTVVLFGDASEVLVLPQIPVTNVSAVQFNTSPTVALTSAQYEWRAIGALRHVGVVATQFTGAQYYDWPFGVPVQVTYDHGYATVPNTIKAVALEAAAAAYLNPNMVATEALGGTLGYTATYPIGSPVGLVALTEEQKRRLDPYRPPMLTGP